MTLARPLLPALLLISQAALIVTSAPAGAHGGDDGAPAASDSGQYVGLPASGQLDPQRVLASRYDSASITTAAVAPPPGGVTDITIESASTAPPLQTTVPVTFGQVFAPGALAKGESLLGKFADGATIPLQLDVKATHADGSVRHAVVSGVVPQLIAGKPQAVALVKSGPATDLLAGAASAIGNLTVTAAGLLGKGFGATVSATIAGQRYSASLDKLLVQQKADAWLAGPIVHEWHVAAPLKTDQGAQHPHLAARFAVRWYHGAGKARVDVAVENNWAYEPAPQNFTYDAEVTVGGKQVYAKQALTHLHHARWRKVFWWGEAPRVHLRHNSAYLIASQALPNYDQSVMVDEASLSALQAKWSGPKTEPMGVGLANPAMPTTGGRPDIGLLPGWAAMYLLSMDPRAKQATLGTADLAGSWSAHYRDKRTGQPVSLLDYPYMTIVGQRGDTLNPATGKHEAFPACPSTDACATPYHHDISHQPAFAYLPYLVTGDYYYLEELQFWAMYDVFASNPGYRQNVKGLLLSEQVRGQAWALRTLAEAAYITPDGHRLKSHFTRILDSNLEWYNANYTNNPAANALGAIVNGYALGYKDGTGLAPWMDDFFTSAVGHVAELGFAQAAPLLAWKAKFPVSRMVGPGVCWITGAIYAMTVRDSASSPIYGSIEEAYRASHTPEFLALPCAGPEMAAALKLRVGEMTGYSATTIGYPSNMQPALAYAASVSGDAGKRAWAQFMARSVKPNYGTGPQFAIVPR
jgi:hypothetical protein